MKAKSYKGIIPVFFSVDYKYAPMLAVALRSMMVNASAEYFYRIYVLSTTLDEKLQKRVAKSIKEFENCSIECVSLKEKLDSYSGMLHLRDYYSQETYFRLFIASLYPEYDKVLYLDSDILVLGDISKMYNTDLGENLLGGTWEEVTVCPACDYYFQPYIEKVLGLNYKDYINAGIILINAKKYREEKIQDKFVALLKRFKFSLVQDEDYLNVLCKDRIHHFDLSWNKTAFENPEFKDKPNIVHYKMMWRPWKYDGVLYGDDFWAYAKQTDFYGDLQSMKNNYSEEDQEKDRVLFGNLENIAYHDIYDFNNYNNTMRRERVEANLAEVVSTAALALGYTATKFLGNAFNNLKFLKKTA